MFMVLEYLQPFTSVNTNESKPPDKLSAES